MASIWINTPRCHVSLNSAHLDVRGPTESNPDSRALIRTIPLFDIDRLYLSVEAAISSAALAELMKREIPVCLLSRHSEFLGVMLPEGRPSGNHRLLQYESSADRVFSCRLAARLVQAKIHNQRRMLQRICSARGEDGQDTLDHLKKLLPPESGVLSVPELMGREGAAAAAYLAEWSRSLPSAYPFERRSRRPPHNPVNACLSFIGSVLYHEMKSAIHLSGLDPAIGFLHATENGRWSLALDLIEPFRPVIVEPLTLDLFSRQMLKANHFERRDGGMFLTPKGRSILVLQLEKRLDREFMSRHTGHRTTLRQRLLHAAEEIKQAVNTQNLENFRPFRVN